jgi:hypothetical protein
MSQQPVGDREFWGAEAVGPPWWVYLLAFLWTLGAVGGIWYIVERLADAA